MPRQTKFHIHNLFLFVYFVILLRRLSFYFFFALDGTSVSSLIQIRAQQVMVRACAHTFATDQYRVIATDNENLVITLKCTREGI